MKKIFVITFLTLQTLALSAQLNTDRVMAIGRNALYFEDYVLSIQYFNQVIKVKPYLTEPYFYRAIAKIELEDYQGAAEDLDEVIARNPFIPMAYYARSFVEKRLGSFDKAEQDIDKALKLSPENMIFLINRLEILEEQERYNEALSDLDFLLKKSGNDANLSMEKGRFMLLAKDTVGALKWFDDLVRTYPKEAEIWGVRALTKLITNDKIGALNDYNEAIALKSSNVGHYINRGILHYQNKNYRNALADYGTALELNPNNEQALFNRALLRSELGDWNNAITDLNQLINQNPTYYEAIYQRALLSSEVGDSETAFNDLNTIIKRYPNFAPAYYQRAQEWEKIGKKKQAFADLETAYDIRKREENKAKETKKDEPDMQVKVTQAESVIKQRSNIFNASINASATASRNASIRGNIQNVAVAAVNERNFTLSYYQKESDVKRPPRYNRTVEKLNASNTMQGTLRLINQETSLNQSLITYHFNTINYLSKEIANAPQNADLYLRRGLNYSLVQDFTNAIDDFSKAILLQSDYETLAYFCRANVRYKELEFRTNNPSELETTDKKAPQDKSYAYDFEMIMRDYDKVLELDPTFSCAWFNRANMLCVQKDFSTALTNYTKAIEIDNDFAEAYFNRGLTYLFIGETEKGTADLSRAGELGIYQAYNLLKRAK